MHIGILETTYSRTYTILRVNAAAATSKLYRIRFLCLNIIQLNITDYFSMKIFFQILLFMIWFVHVILISIYKEIITQNCLTVNLQIWYLNESWSFLLVYITRFLLSSLTV